MFPFITRDVVELAPAVVLCPAAGAAAPVPVFARHAQQAAGHGQLGGLGKVGQHAAR